MVNKEYFKCFVLGRYCEVRFPPFYLNPIVALPGSNTARVAEYDAPDTTPAPPTEKLESMRNISN